MEHRSWLPWPAGCASSWRKTSWPFGSVSNATICSGFGSSKKYDNFFNASLFNGEEIEDHLVLQRDFETDSFTAGEVTPISDAIKTRGTTTLDVVRTLARRGYSVEAENLLRIIRRRISGDYLQTSDIVREGCVIGVVNDPNDYAGPGTGYRMSEQRWHEVRGIRNVLTKDIVLATEDTGQSSPWLQQKGPAHEGSQP